MTAIKTAISIQRPLFEQAQELALELKIPRSQVFVLALQDYIRRYQNRQLLARINAAYADGPTAEEQAVHEHMRRLQRQMVEGEW